MTPIRTLKAKAAAARAFGEKTVEVDVSDVEALVHLLSPRPQPNTSGFESLGPMSHEMQRYVLHAPERIRETMERARETLTTAKSKTLVKRNIWPDQGNRCR